MMMHAPATSTTVVVSAPTVVYVNFTPMWGTCCRPETNPPEGPFDRNDYSLHLQPYMAREEYQDAIDSINYTYRQTGLGARSKFTMGLLLSIGLFFTMFIIAGVVGVEDQAPAFPLTVFGCLFVFMICAAVIYHRKSVEAIAKLRQMIASINAQYSSRNMQWRFVVQTTTTHEYHHHHGHTDHHHHRRNKTTWWIEIELGIATTTTVSYPGTVPAPVDPYAQYPPPVPHPSQPYPPQPSPYEQQPYPPHPVAPHPSAPYPPQQPYPPQPSPYDQQQGYPPQQGAPYPPQPQQPYPPQPFATPAPVDPSFQQQGYVVPPQQPQQPNLLDLEPAPPQK